MNAEIRSEIWTSVRHSAYVLALTAFSWFLGPNGAFVFDIFRVFGVVYWFWTVVALGNLAERTRERSQFLATNIGSLANCATVMLMFWFMHAVFWWLGITVFGAKVDGFLGFAVGSLLYCGLLDEYLRVASLEELRG